MTAERARLPLGPHGGDAAPVAAALGRSVHDLIDLSMSMNPVAPSLAPSANAHLGAIERYPDPTPAQEALAAAIGVAPERLVVTNGGSEAIALVAAELRAGEVIDPEFSLYARHLVEVRPGAGRWRSNPSNPLGTLAAPDERAAVWDEAFWPLTTGTWTRGDEESWRLGSLTKLWSCPGLRLGYAIAPDGDGAARVRERQPRWAVNGLAAALAPELVERTDLAAWSTAAAAVQADLARELSALGFAVRVPAAPWLLVDHDDLRERLAPHGVLVRDCTSFGLAGTFRVGLPRPSQLERVVAAFAAVAASAP